MQLYNEWDLFPGEKRCQETIIYSDDKVFELDINYYYMPEKPKIWIYCCLEVLDSNSRNIPDRFIENDGTDESKHDFMIRVSKWIKSRQKYYNGNGQIYISNYTCKKMMLLVAKAFDRVLK